MPFAVGFTVDEILQALSSCLKCFNFNVLVNIASRPVQHFSILLSVSVSFFSCLRLKHDFNIHGLESIYFVIQRRSFAVESNLDCVVNVVQIPQSTFVSI